MAQSSSAEKQSVSSCQVGMQAGKRCGRSIHPAPGHDERPVCLMHSKDPQKNRSAFQAEFDHILAEAEHNNTVADFQGFVFPAADYSGRTFLPKCNFWDATFSQYANFSGTTFTQHADFRHAVFKQSAIFIGATFTQNVDFRATTFAQVTLFSVTTFSQKANFIGATFSRYADFFDATFADMATFREARFRNDISLEPSLIFTDVNVAHPERIEFYKNDLGQALFHNTDVSKFDFTLIQWYDKGRINRFRRKCLFFLVLRFFVLRRRNTWMKRWKLLARTTHPRNPRHCLFDEVVGPAHTWALSSKKNTSDARNYSLIAETYQQLKRNFDAKGDYWTAGHWHYGEMEMKRLHSRWSWKPMRWLSQNLSLAALYKYASEYGESYTRPLFWLAAILLGFSLLYPLIGVYPSTGLDLNLPNATSTAKDAT